ncbi:single-stranded DNA endonuclease [Mesorhizobium sp. LNHC232B00]|nr:single-stranded DNA endonuclease [Mesorhizobium sp. LNHC232B00]
MLTGSSLTMRRIARGNGRERNADHVPVVKFFNPLGEGVWLAIELNANGDEMFGLADLGYPELGSERLWLNSICLISIA